MTSWLDLFRPQPEPNSNPLGLLKIPDDMREARDRELAGDLVAAQIIEARFFHVARMHDKRIELLEYLDGRTTAAIGKMPHNAELIEGVPDDAATMTRHWISGYGGPR